MLFLLVSGCRPTSADALELADLSVTTEDMELRRFLDGLIDRAKEYPNSALYRGRLAMALDANSFTAEAIKTYRQAHLLDNVDSRWPYLESLATASQGQIELAVSLMDRAIELEPSYLPSYLAKGFWLLDLGEYESACTTFDQASTVGLRESEGAVIRLGMAQCAFELGDVERAQTILATIPSDEATTYTELVRRRINRGLSSSRETVSENQRLLDEDQPSWSDPIAGAVVEFTRGLSSESILAQKLIEGGRSADALGLVESLRERYPTEPHLVELHSAALVKLERFEDAITVLADGMAEFPDAHLLQFNAGLLHETIGQMDQAIAFYDAAIRLDSTFVPAYDAKATLFIEDGQNDRAIESLKSSIPFRLPDWHTFYKLGVLYGAQGEWRLSVSNLQSASELSPDNVEILASLAMSLAELDQHEDALAMIHRAQELEPTNPKVMRAVETMADRVAQPVELQ